MGGFVTALVLIRLRRCTTLAALRLFIFAALICTPLFRYTFQLPGYSATMSAEERLRQLEQLYLCGAPYDSAMSMETLIDSLICLYDECCSSTLRKVRHETEQLVGDDKLFKPLIRTHSTFVGKVHRRIRRVRPSGGVARQSAAAASRRLRGTQGDWTRFIWRGRSGPSRQYGQSKLTKICTH